ncbi:MAG: AbiJ-NTD4 domain-containing protein [Pseudomonas sp.]|uniref:AbiJ-NTD4 domain-containing protein n=1 Tax=Pseudomonas sp. TaxID=306 RepID=UPI003D0B9683
MELDFSQRMGLRPISFEIQLEDISDDLRTAIWNVLHRNYLVGYIPKSGSRFRRVAGSNRHKFALNYYCNFKRVAVDTLPTEWKDFLSIFRTAYFRMPWHRVYSLLEFVVANVGAAYREILIDNLNRVLEGEGSGYRLVSGRILAITSSHEIEAVEAAIAGGASFPGIREHLTAAVRLLSDMDNPDYRNSIKESISAVESLAKHITGNQGASLGAALSELEKMHGLHPALKGAFSSLYGWTSNAEGIRHALMDVSNLSQSDARFMLICCSAFINFAIDSARDKR